MFHLLKCIAGAVVKNGGKFLLNLVPGAEALADIAADAWEKWRQKRDEAALRGEVQGLAQASAAQVREEVLAAVQAEAAHQPPKLQEALIGYLTQVPAMIRRSLRRPSDPTGTTVQPECRLSGGEDLLPFLPPRPPRFQAGQTLPGLDWELVELLGVGGFGEVWKARHLYLTTEPPVALKFCLDDTEAAGKALRNEVGVLDRVRRHGRHGGIVALRQTYLSARPPCLEYEYVEGGDLTGLILELKHKGQLTPATATRLLLSLAKIVAFGHRAEPPIIHCDLKPANILVQRNAKRQIVLRITDFGIGGLAASHAIQRTRHGATSRPEMVTEAVRGAYTPLYASPEQVVRRRDQPPDPRDDVHALGVIWYQLITGDLGLTAMPTDWREEVQDRGLGDDLTKLLAACIASKAEKRPANAIDLTKRLTGLLTPADVPPPLSARQVGNVPHKSGSGLLTPADLSSSPLPARNKDSQPLEIMANSLGMKLAWIPAGGFLMGSPPSEAERSDDETQHRVTLTKGFFMGIHPVTQAQWRALMGDNPSHFQGEDRPVETVSWENCQEFCKALSAKEGKPYRLPTEAEWEYACRAGTTTPFHFGETISTSQVNYDGNYPYGSGEMGQYRQQTTPMGSFPANAWGLHDMHGNVWEWCVDWYGEYPQSNSTDPQSVTDGGARVLRGGSWYDYARFCRSARRDWLAPGKCNRYSGFRVCVCLE